MESSGLRELLLLICFFLGPWLSVSQSKEKQQIRLTAGESFTFPDAIIPSGHLKYTGQGTIITVQNNVSDTDYETSFRGRVYWDRRTGQITITNLTVQDSGEFELESTKANRFIENFILKVYNRVSRPQVKNSDQRHNQFSGASFRQNCSLLCSVQNGREVTLSWYREVEEKPLSNTSSPDLNSTLTLPLETDGQYNNTYSCVASNPVSNETTTVNTSERCRNRDNKNHSNSDQSRHYAVSAVCSVGGVLAVIGAVAYLKRHRDKQREGPPSTPGVTENEGVEYTEINHILSSTQAERANRNDQKYQGLIVQTMSLRTLCSKHTWQVTFFNKPYLMNRHVYDSPEDA
ncbi:CD48 antigen-like isoform X3 [Lepisosteus oculatus]|uniref:CD48 antigen-like isoform X3 n=1 Tax=Lepisosteus oculatus TaxID=7918 RepID=UPI00371998E9